ncbi:hypothetical protein ACNAW0_21680 [Micromonospora sp. SL1-18]|uniref:hypothetical protein n=1 Tax=Micromonospora sp. SL1-18 TaxID=3399128 RepID=UPI003A4E658A
MSCFALLAFSSPRLPGIAGTGYSANFSDENNTCPLQYSRMVSLHAVDTSKPNTPPEVGYAVTAPEGNARSYPVFMNGLIPILDRQQHLPARGQVRRPRANALPGPHSGVHEGNSTSPHH